MFEPRHGWWMVDTAQSCNLSMSSSGRVSAGFALLCIHHLPVRLFVLRGNFALKSPSKTISVGERTLKKCNSFPLSRSYKSPSKKTLGPTGVRLDNDGIGTIIYDSLRISQLFIVMVIKCTMINTGCCACGVRRISISYQAWPVRKPTSLCKSPLRFTSDDTLSFFTLLQCNISE